ncbi:hypothetical protein DTO271D3_1878 [Paecilomyces variotii]|nr:hypothetical protein DTO271D3_1878 [Paecilomyces variotii]
MQEISFSSIGTCRLCHQQGHKKEKCAFRADDKGTWSKGDHSIRKSSSKNGREITGWILERAIIIPATVGAVRLSRSGNKK